MVTKEELEALGVPAAKADQASKSKTVSPALDWYLLTVSAASAFDPTALCHRYPLHVQTQL